MGSARRDLGGESAAQGRQPLTGGAAGGYDALKYAYGETADMNLFLTGPRQVGKSTALGRALDMSGLRAAGVVSTFGPDRFAAEKALYLAPFGGRAALDAAHCCARMDAQGKHPIPAVFDDCGAALLYAAMADPAAELVVIDELGFLEAEAAGFRAAVLAALAGPKPVLGVVRQGLGCWGGVDLGQLWEVTPENRDALPLNILRFLSEQ